MVKSHKTATSHTLNLKQKVILKTAAPKFFGMRKDRRFETAKTCEVDALVEN